MEGYGFNMDHAPQRGPEYWKRMSKAIDRLARRQQQAGIKPMYEYALGNTRHEFQPGDRVMSKATRTLGHVDRVLPVHCGMSRAIGYPTLIIITDAGQTVQDHPGHVEWLREPELTPDDVRFLQDLKVVY